MSLLSAAGVVAAARVGAAGIARPGAPLLPQMILQLDDTGGMERLPAPKIAPPPLDLLLQRHCVTDPRYQPMEARQILAASDGFVWAMRTRGGMPVSGSDSGTWTRFRIFGLIPVARLGGDLDHARSAFGRYVAEATFWTPAALLPGPGVTWEAVDEDTARVAVRHRNLEQAVDVTVDPEGQPVEVVFQRWSDSNPEKAHRLQPFGGYLSDFREVGGYRLPFRVEAGNMFGTGDYFPFFLAEVTDIRFPEAAP